MYLFALIMIVLNLAAFGPDFGSLSLAYRQRFHAVFYETTLAVTDRDPRKGNHRCHALEPINIPAITCEL